MSSSQSKGMQMKGRIALRAVVIGVTSFSAYSQTVTLLPVKVTAPRMGGGQFSCHGTACSSAVNQESFAAHQRFLEENARYPDEPPELDQDRVCRAMHTSRPSNCDYGSPPSVPGFSPGWVPNGCGTGPRANWFLDRALSQSNSSSYSGDLNAPFAGVSFLAACNSHDACWGSAMHRASCDIQFGEALTSACSGQATPESYNVCVGYAEMYHGAVSTTNGSNEAYARAVNENSCAAWVYDMKANGCAP